MASRSKTLVFLQFRATFSRDGPRTQRRDADSENAKLIDQTGRMDNDEHLVEMDNLPPRWIDIVEEVDEDIAKIKLKITELEAMQKKQLLPGFSDDRIGSEQNIDRFSQQITNMFRVAQRKIKKIESEANQHTTSAASQDYIKFGKNIQVSLAAKLQDVSAVFRKAQNAYLSKLRGRETRSKDIFQQNTPSGSGGDPEEDEDDLDAVFTDAQMATLQNNERAISEREKEINDIVKSINGLAEIFRELQTMVIDQGTVLDRIDYNIEMTATYMQDAHVQLQKASEYQEKTKGKLCIIFLALLVFILLVIIFYKVIQGK